MNFDGESSSSSHIYDHDRIYEYDAFITFRGETRNGFTSHLFQTLSDADYNTFLDEDEIETGEPLKQELESGIKSSRAFIIVLSKNYASSTWCLDELVLILEQKRNCKQIVVIPIFYDVEPSDVRKQKNSFREAMKKHKQSMKAETDADKKSQWAQKIESWKKALKEVAEIIGEDARNRRETEVINEVLTTIRRKLGLPSSNTLPFLIGMDSHIQRISSWVTDGSCHTANILTLVGTGGIGKTPLARYIFMKHSAKFQKSSFIEGINTKKLLKSQKQLHGNISKKTRSQIDDVSKYTCMIEKALTHKKVFIVLDDVGNLKQLDALLGNKGLYPGSKIIVTTQNASLTRSCALIKLQDSRIPIEYVALDGLSKTGSLKLLCIYAFKSQEPEEGFELVLEKLLKYCDGNPLALEVLGKSLYNQDVAYWNDIIEGFKEETDPSIICVLQRSLHSLSKNDMDLFKYIACFFVGQDRDLTETILNACGIKTRSGIKNLTDRRLLGTGLNNELVMRSLIQEMGRDLARQEHVHKPWKRSLLWCHEESLRVLKEEKGTENILGLALDMKKLDKEISFELETDSLSNMDNLMLLQLNFVQFSGSDINFPKCLRWLCLLGSPLKCVPSEWQLESLVVLNLSYSSIKSFGMWNSNPQPPTKKQKNLAGSCSNGKRLLGKLKILELSCCKHLRYLGGFFELPSLERLVVGSSSGLTEVCESIEHCVELHFIDLSNCCKLRKLPISIGKLKNVRTLLSDGCNSCESQIKTCDMISSHTSMNSQTSLSAIKEAITSYLKFFEISLPSSLIILSLANNNLSNKSFPLDFRCLSMLKKLCLDNNLIDSMPSCVRTLPFLENLHMENCKMLISIEHPPRTLRVLSVVSSYTPSIRKIKFDPDMSPLELRGIPKVLTDSLYEIDGMVNIQDMSGVDEKVLHSLDWKNSGFIRSRRFGTSQTKMYYEFGIFSLIYEGKKMLSCITHRNNGPLIKYTIPSSPKKLRGLNFCCVETHKRPHNTFTLPIIKISNSTKNHTWIYRHCIDEVNLDGKDCFSFLSHWMFGPEQMKGGDDITIAVQQRPDFDNEQYTKNCGMRLVYDDDGRIEEEDNVLGYFKSWNHIIGGDLSPFQLTTGEYTLDNLQFTRYTGETYSGCVPLIDDGANYKEDEVNFTANSQKNHLNNCQDFSLGLNGNENLTK